MNIFYLFFVFASPIAFSWTHVGSNILGWSSHKVVFHVNPTNCSLPESTLYDIIDHSINAWNSLPTTDLVLSRSPDVSTTTYDQLNLGTATDAPVILCDTEMTAHGMQGDNIPASTVKIMLNAAGNISYAGILLNAESGAAANLDQLTTGETEVTLTHEIGHALGLGHSSQAQALMYYSIDGKTKATVTEDDMDGINHLYPRNEFANGQFGCSAVHASPNKKLGLLEFFLIIAGFAIAHICAGRKIKPGRLPSLPE